MWRPSARVQVGQLGPNTFTLPGMRTRPTGQRLLAVVAALAAACASFPALVPSRGCSRRVIACAGAWCSLGQQSTAKNSFGLAPVQRVLLCGERLRQFISTKIRVLVAMDSREVRGAQRRWSRTRLWFELWVAEVESGHSRGGRECRVAIPLRWPAVCGRVV